MSQPIAQQHPAVVLRSHYAQVRALLAISMIAVVGLTIAVVVLATDNAGGTSLSSSPAAPVRAAAPAAPNVRYDGGPEEGTRGTFGRSLGGATSATSGAAISRLSRLEHGSPHLYNGGHDEGNALR